jgi:hypothetical protein
MSKTKFSKSPWMVTPQGPADANGMGICSIWGDGEELTFITPKKQKIDYVSRKAIDGIMDNRILAELNDDFAHCKDIY